MLLSRIFCKNKAGKKFCASDSETSQSVPFGGSWVRQYFLIVQSLRKSQNLSDIYFSYYAESEKIEKSRNNLTRSCPSDQILSDNFIY